MAQSFDGDDFLTRMITGLHASGFSVLSLTALADPIQYPNASVQYLGFAVPLYALRTNVMCGRSSDYTEPPGTVR